MGRPKKPSPVPSPPQLTGGPKLEFKEIKRMAFGCPKCGAMIDITDISDGVTISCNSCKNITWTPNIKVRWWNKTGNYVLSMAGSLVTGVLVKVIVESIISNSKGVSP